MSLKVSSVNSSQSLVLKFKIAGIGVKLISLVGFANLFQGHTSWHTSQPNIQLSNLFFIASSVEDQENVEPPISQLKEEMMGEVSSEEGVPVWSIYYPIKHGTEKANIHVLVSLKFVSIVTNTFFKINLIGALLSTILLILILNFF